LVLGVASRHPPRTARGAARARRIVPPDRGTSPLLRAIQTDGRDRPRSVGSLSVRIRPRWKDVRHA
jgi:hypothetical protein